MLSLHCEQLQEILGSLMHQQHKNPANERWYHSCSMDKKLVTKGSCSCYNIIAYNYYMQYNDNFYSLEVIPNLLHRTDPLTKNYFMEVIY